MEQVHFRKVLKSRFMEDLTDEEKNNALKYLIFLKEMTNGIIKDCGYTDGRPQHTTTDKNDKQANTVGIESLFHVSTINTNEKRDVAVVDISGAFMQADYDEPTVLKFEGKMAEILEKCDLKLYRKYLVHKNGEPVLYYNIVKALYGAVRATKLFWGKLTDKLAEELGFK